MSTRIRFLSVRSPTSRLFDFFGVTMTGKRKRETTIQEKADALASSTSSDATQSDTTSSDDSVVLFFSPVKLAQGVETVVELAAPWYTSFLVKLTVESGSFLHIWAEDRTLKKQWQTGKLKTEDFVSANAAIPGATLTDYATCFINCLNLRKSHGNSVEIVKSDGEEGDLELHLSVKVKVFASEWDPKYTFLLKQVALEPVDRVFAKLRDQEEWIREQDAKIAMLEDAVHNISQQPAPTTPAFFRADGTTKSRKNQPIPWQITDGSLVDRSDRAPSPPTDRIIFEVSAVFVLHFYVSHSSTKSGVVFDVQLNDDIVASCFDTGAKDVSKDHDRVMSSLCHVMRVARNDQLSVTYRGNRSAFKESYIVAYELR